MYSKYIRSSALCSYAMDCWSRWGFTILLYGWILLSLCKSVINFCYFMKSVRVLPAGFNNVSFSSQMRRRNIRF
ncbi:unnamed protein product [Hymenolepis diminuta]|uniref:Uncharacterized protein n=1 Tax=Hymenolepis diminuta TaxID=6216 RepID=A0A3P6YA03_HYMDI|nr:unnamed protein product [Hymenolepis diminuta]